MTEQAERKAEEGAPTGAPASGPSVLERIGEEGLREAARKATPFWTRLRGKGPIAERTLREILAQAYTVRDVDRQYRERHWRRTDYRSRPRRHKVLPVLRKMGVPEK